MACCGHVDTSPDGRAAQDQGTEAALRAQVKRRQRPRPTAKNKRGDPPLRSDVALLATIS